ncbi:MAG: glycosyltransferase family 4 protein [Deltaproteobacteria bacterium]|nr:glycosyltransferase family 4 protein [Deltaproteobacteria bacterium]
MANVLFHTARAAYRGGVLDAVLCYGNRQTEIPSRCIRPIRFQPVKVLSFLKSRYYYTLKRMTLDRRGVSYLRRRGCNLFHGWTTECIRSLEEAKRSGAKTIVERPAPHPRTAWRLLTEEYERWGVPFPRDGGSRWLRNIDWRYRDEVIAPREFDLADRIVVQSEFGVRSFLEQGVPSDKLVLLPRAVEPGEYSLRPPSAKGLFRVLFVGTVCLRKGFLDLLHAWAGLDLPDGELRGVGEIHEEIVPFLEPYRDRSSIRFLGHRKEGVARLYSDSSVFVLPSITEGSAKSTYEAMAAGLPVITTLNAGSVVRDQTDGFIVPIRDPDAIREKLLYLYRNRKTAGEMGESGRARVASFSWETFENRVIELHSGLLGGPAEAGKGGQVPRTELS